MKHVILTLNILLISILIRAQNNDWLLDPAINYLIEVDAEVGLEEVLQLDQKNAVNHWQRMKLSSACANEGELTAWLSDILLQQLEAGELTAQSIAMGKQLNFAEVSDYYYSLDTVVTFHPATYEERVQIVRYQHQLSGLRLKLQLAWDDSRYQLQAKVVGFSAIGHKGQDEGVLFYVPLTALPITELDINNEDWDWVGKSELTLDWKTASVIKGASIADFIEEVFLEEAFEYYTLQVYTDPCAKGPLSDSELDILSTHTDTLTVYDPDTYEATTRVTYTPVAADDLSKARLGLDCYLSRGLNKFHFAPQLLSPLEAERDGNGNIRRYNPLYYLRFE